MYYTNNNNIDRENYPEVQIITYEKKKKKNQ